VRIIPLGWDMLDEAHHTINVVTEHGKRPGLDPHGVDHQRVAFVVADGTPIPGRSHLCGISLVQAHVADFMWDGPTVRACTTSPCPRA
jgi:hypothetical protein